MKEKARVESAELEALITKGQRQALADLLSVKGYTLEEGEETDTHTQRPTTFEIDGDQAGARAGGGDAGFGDYATQIFRRN